MSKRFKKTLKTVFIFTLIFSWVFSGWPNILDFNFNGENLKLPPKIQETRAALPCGNGTLNGATCTYTVTGADTFTSPAGVTSVDAECWGGGGAGGGSDSNKDGAGGGGGGAYSKKTGITVVPDTEYTVTIGAGGIGVLAADGGGGGDSWFINNTTVLAKGGLGGLYVTSTGGPGGAGGDAASGIGDDPKYSGGAGGRGKDNNSGAGGPGGSSAGTASNGNSGADTWTTSTGMTAVTGGGPGGNGHPGPTGDGYPPDSGPGGGGGGSAEETTISVKGGNGYAGQVKLTWTAPPTTTLTNGASEPSSVTIAPGASITDLDNFTLQTSTATDTVTGATVTLGPANAYNNIHQVDITNTSNVAQCTAVTSLSSNTVSFPASTCTIPVTTTETTFKVRITPKSHANMPAVPGASYDTTGWVTSFTTTNTQSGSDTGSATITVDNLSPAGTTGANTSPGDGQVDVEWTPPGDSDFQQVYIYCKTSSMISGEAPTEGTDPSVDGTACDGTARMKYKGTASPQTISSLTNDTLYYFRIYARDDNGNFTAYASTQEVSATPVAGLSTAIEIRNVADTADVATITFPSGASSAIISNPTGNVDVQVLTAIASEASPVAILKSAAAYTLWYNVTSTATWGDAVASEKLYTIAIDADLDLTTFGTNAYNITVWGTDQETTQALDGTNSEELYLQVTLSALAGKTGTSTLTILGETP